MPEVKNEKIKLPLSLALNVATILREKHKIDHWKGLFDDSFTQEELSLIKDIRLNNPVAGDCEGLEFLPNLEGLFINSDMYHDSAIDGSCSLCDRDMEHIYKCKNLTSLQIKNQPNITEIELENLPKLDDVQICNNAQLESITGIDKLPDLWFLDCYGNEKLRDIPNLNEAIKESPCQVLNLDVIVFPKAINYNPQTGFYDQSVIDKLNAQERVQWIQNLYQISDLKHPAKTKNIVINQSQMIQLHNKACQILDENVPPHKGVRETIIAIEKFLAEKVTYDDDSIQTGNKHTHHDSNGQPGPEFGANGAYDCLIFGSCVCQGYSRGEQYLLALKGIKSSAVSCVGTKDTLDISDSKKTWGSGTGTTLMARNTGADHSIIRIDDYFNLYSDPCWNAGHWQSGDKSMPYSLLTKGQISDSHTLLYFDRNISNDHLPESREIIADIITSNELFIKTKTAQVDEQRRHLREEKIPPVRGMIQIGR